MNCKRIIPDAITSCNLLCGSIAVFLATQGAFLWAFIFILAGAFFDFFDGLTARLLKAPSPIGIQLDSLADDITFGLAPAMMLFCYLRPILGWWALIALLMAAFSALRLAKFNVDERQHDSFIGLATPANAIFWGGICSLPISVLTYDWMAWVLIGISLLSCYLRMFGYSWLLHCQSDYPSAYRVRILQRYGMYLMVRDLESAAGMREK